MKKKIAILGSTGSIGKTTFNIIKKNKKDFKVVLLTTNKNVNLVIKQARILKVKNIIISSKQHYLKAINSKNKNIKIYNNLNNLNKIIKKKLDYCMCSITGLAGLKPTMSAIKLTKKIAIANKGSIICAWNLIKKELKKHKTIFIPVDSEHFSILPIIFINLVNNETAFIKFNIINILFSLLVSLICQLGDLFFSYFKRLNNKKNTSNLLPGHGGLLDRIDGLVIVLPIVFLIKFFEIF